MQGSKQLENHTDHPSKRKIIRKHTVSAEFREIYTKRCGCCAFPKNFCTRKLGKTMIFGTVFLAELKLKGRRGAVL